MTKTLTLKGKMGVGGAAVAAAMAIAVPVVSQWEGKRNDPYNDIIGVRTVCYGETQGIQERRYSDAECKAMLMKRLERDYMKPVLECTPSLADMPEILAAASSLAYNIGTTAYCRSTADRRFDAGDYKGGCDALMSWVYAGGKRIKGLENRRKAERDLCMKGVS